MEDLTREYLDMFSSNRLDTDWEISVLKKVEKIPRDMVESALGKMKLYDVMDVGDIYKNYRILRKPGFPSYRFLKWIQKKSKEVKRSPIFQEYKDLVKEYGYLEEDLVGAKKIFLGGSFDSGQMNQASIYGVRLKKFESVVTPLISASLFDVVDGNGESIRGVFVYDRFTWNMFSVNSKHLESPAEQLRKAQSAPDNASFNLMFHALDPDYSSKTFPEKRGPTIKVLKIRLDDGGVRKLETLPVM